MSLVNWIQQPPPWGDANANCANSASQTLTGGPNKVLELNRFARFAFAKRGVGVRDDAMPADECPSPPKRGEVRTLDRGDGKPWRVYLPPDLPAETLERFKAASLAADRRYEAVAEANDTTTGNGGQR